MGKTARPDISASSERLQVCAEYARVRLAFGGVLEAALSGVTSTAYRVRVIPHSRPQQALLNCCQGHRSPSLATQLRLALQGSLHHDRSSILSDQNPRQSTFEDDSNYRTGVLERTYL